jgi:hypothetical protein
MGKKCKDLNVGQGLMKFTKITMPKSLKKNRGIMRIFTEFNGNS